VKRENEKREERNEGLTKREGKGTDLSFLSEKKVFSSGKGKKKEGSTEKQSLLSLYTSSRRTNRRRRRKRGGEKNASEGRKKKEGTSGQSLFRAVDLSVWATAVGGKGRRGDSGEGC